MYRQTYHPGQRPKRRGVTISEFAVVAPVFFVILFAGIEFSVLNTIRNTANNAAYEGARKLVIPGAIASTGKLEAERIMGIVGVNTLTVTVTPATIDDETREVTVDVSIPYANNAIIVPWFTGGVTIHSQVTLLTERYGGVGGS
jgi:Flp pilus assembly protein TadG